MPPLGGGDASEGRERQDEVGVGVQHSSWKNGGDWELEA